MEDVHLGFNPSFIEESAGKFFPSVHIERMPCICCECFGRSAELFVAYLTCEWDAASNRNLTLAVHGLLRLYQFVELFYSLNQGPIAEFYVSY